MELYRSRTGGGSNATNQRSDSRPWGRSVGDRGGERGQPPPGLPPTPSPIPNRQNRTTKQTHLAEPHRNQRFSQHPALTCRTPPGVPCRHSWRHILPAQPHNLSTLHPPPVAKPVCQTDPIPKNQSRSTSHGHLPRTASRISPAAAAIENHRSAELEETRGFSWPAEPLIPQSPAPAKLRRSDTSNSLGREPQDHRPKTVSPGRGGTHPFTTNTAHRAAESTAGIPRWNPRYRNPKSPDPPVTRFLSRRINNIRKKHPKTLDSAC